MAEDFNRHLPNTDGKKISALNKHIQTLHTMSSGKCKLKQRSNNTYPLEWPKPRVLPTMNAGKDVVQQKCSFITGGNVKWDSYFGRVWHLRTKLNIFLACNLAITLPGIFPKELGKELSSHEKT